MPLQDIFLGESYQLKARLDPVYASNKDVTWEVISGEAVTVDENGLLTAVATGTAVVKVTTSDGGFSDSCEITVTLVPVSSVQLKNCPGDSLNIGDTVRLTAYIMPEDAADKTVFWTSSDTMVATVDTNGLVTAKSPGKASITVSTNDGGFMDACNLTVLDPLSSNSPTHSEFSLNGITLYPNPAKDILNIHFPDAKLEKRLKIFNLHGQNLANAYTFNDHLELDLEKIGRQSMLLIEISLGDKTLLHKIMVK